LAVRGCELESDKIWAEPNINQLDKGKFYLLDKIILLRDAENIRQFPAYDILWDICVKYAKEFFGEHYLEHTSRIFQFISATNCNAQMKTMLEDSMGIVENYIWTNCCFNKVKKEATNAKT